MSINNGIKKAVIVAAGKSSRLYPLTLDTPKCLLKIGQREIIYHSLLNLKSAGITEVFIVIGYLYEKISTYLSSIEQEINIKITTITNPFFEQCNNMGSLWFAKKFVKNDPFIYLHADIYYHKEILSNALQFRANDLKYDIILITDTTKKLDEEAMKVEMSHNNLFIQSNKEIPITKAHGEWTGIAIINNHSNLFQMIEKNLFHDGLNHYDTYSFNELAKTNKAQIICVSTNDSPWLEIDFAADYKAAQELVLR